MTGFYPGFFCQEVTDNVRLFTQCLKLKIGCDMKKNHKIYGRFSIEGPNILGEKSTNHPKFPDAIPCEKAAEP